MGPCPLLDRSYCLSSLLHRHHRVRHGFDCRREQTLFDVSSVLRRSWEIGLTPSQSGSDIHDQFPDRNAFRAWGDGSQVV